METLNLTQGSAAWHEHRATAFNASDAPAMMGASKYMSRADLLHQKATGQEPEVTPAKQALFNKGHAAEEAARPIAAEIVGEELFRVSGTNGYLSASFDGLTMLEDVVWEHKLHSEPLAEQIEAEDLEPHYYWQLEQQLLVSGADKCLFMASDGTRDNCVWMWYEPVPGRADDLMRGWQQFEKDLVAYEPREAKPDAVAAPQETLPAVSVQVSGEIAIHDNLDVFGEALKQYVEGLNMKPETDQEFADLEAAAKSLKKAEEALTAAEDSALAQTDSIERMRRAVEEYRNLARNYRLRADKAVKAEKENRKNAILWGAVDALSETYDNINASLEGVYLIIPADFRSNVAHAMKGKKTIKSLQDAADTAVAQAKIEANQTADTVRANLKVLAEHGEHRHLFPDLQQIATKPNDDFVALLKARIAEHKDAEERWIEQERERIRQEEGRKALEAEQARNETTVRPAGEAREPVGPPTANQSVEQSTPRQEPFTAASDGYGGIGIALADGVPVSLSQDDARQLRDNLTAALRTARKEVA